METEFKKISELQKGDVMFSDGGTRESKILGIKHDHSDENCKTDVLLDNGYRRWQEISKESNLKSSESVCVSSGHLVYGLHYTTKREALENKKKDLLDELNKLKNEAIKHLNLVKDFREKHYEELNITLTDNELSKLNCL